MTPSYGFYGAAQLLQMMHLLTEHDFFLRRTRVNAGFLKDINQTDPVMVDAGWKLVGPHGTIVPCCIELHWNRKVVAESEAKNADKRAVASLSGAASSSNSSIYQMSNSRGRNAVSLLGIMATAGELWVLGDWLLRHAALYSKLVIIDGANDAVHNVTRRICAPYGNVILIRQPALTNVTDQSVRWLAMSALGDPVGSWIHLAHPDEFYLIDPRQVVAHVEWADPLANVINWRPEWAVPTADVWNRLTNHTASYFNIRDGDGRHWYTNGTRHTSSSSREFHIMQELRHVDGNYRMCEERMFRWCQGCKWLPERHGIVTPALFPNKRPFGPMGESYQGCIKLEFNAPWYIHFKVHRFEPAFAAALRRSKAFSNSGLKTSLEWSGGVGDYYQQAPKKVGHRLFIAPIAVNVEEFVRERCEKVGRLVEYKQHPEGKAIIQSIAAEENAFRSGLTKERTMRYPGCQLPWQLGAAFKS